MGDQHDKRHNGSAESKRQFPRYAERELAAHQITGKSAAQQTPYASRRAGHPGESSHGFNIKAASVVEIFWEPEEVEEPGCIAQKLGGHKPPGLAHAKQLDPRQPCR